MRLTTKVEKVLGDLKYESPFLSVEEYGVGDAEVSVTAQGFDNGALLSVARDVLAGSGLSVEIRTKYDTVNEIIVRRT